MRNISLLTLALASTVALSGCVAPAGGGYGQPQQSQYSGYQQQPQQNGYQQQQQQNVQYGTVISVRQVAIQTGSAGQPPIGALLGAVAGGVLGNTMGKGKGHIVGAVAGAALGGLAGNAIQNRTEANNSGLGLEITVGLRNGGQVTVTQPANQQFNPGDRVTVVQNPDGSNSVSH